MKNTPLLHAILLSSFALVKIAGRPDEVIPAQPSRDSSGAASTRRELLGATRRPVEGCWSKSEQGAFYERGDSQAPSGHFLERLKRYQRMHRRCTSDVSNWQKYLEDPSAGVSDGADLAGCKYLVFQSPKWHGVGNRIMGLVSALALALLTDRAILLEDREFLGVALCNPFSDSSWHISKEDFNGIDRRVKQWSKDPEKNKTVFDLHLSWNDHVWTELCEERQRELESMRFGQLYTDFYLVPLFYLHDGYKEELDRLFPDRRAFMHLGRHFLFPGNHLWDRITRTYNGYLRHHHRRVGLQIRETTDTGLGLMSNVFDCLVNKSRFLPDAMPAADWRRAAGNAQSEGLLAFPRQTTGVFVTSLNGQHASFLHDRYTRGKPLDGSAISVYTLSHFQQERKENNEHYAAALVEIWLLSFSDNLLVTDYSTFGYVASGLGGLDPYMMNVAIRGSIPEQDWRYNGRPSCVPAFGEPCLVADVQQKCQSDKEQYLAADEKFLQKCPGVNRFLMVAPLSQ